MNGRFGSSDDEKRIMSQLLRPTKIHRGQLRALMASRPEACSEKNTTGSVWEDDEEKESVCMSAPRRARVRMLVGNCARVRVRARAGARACG
eukprot:1456857-Pleurochrysis_carterae.AAC.1